MSEVGLDFHPEAASEVVSAFEYYEQIDGRLAIRFKRELSRAETLARRSPETWPPFHEGTQGIRLRGFPFVLAYLIRDDRIWVVAVAHTSRRPGYWHERI